MPSLSAHLVEDYEKSFPQQIVQSGAMEYNAYAHGHNRPSIAPFSQFSETAVGNSSLSDASFGQAMRNMAVVRSDTAAPMNFQQMMAFQQQREEAQALRTAAQLATLQAKLNQKLGPEFISQRPGPGGGPKLTYVEGWKAINIANEVFGFNGWSSSITNLTVDYIDYNQETQRYNVGVSAIVKVCLRDGVSHEDVGYGQVINVKNKGEGLDKCKKEAVTDGVKRALRNFGNVLGNCIYDKDYTNQILKMKAPAPPKLGQQDLHRRKEFVETSTAAGLSNQHPPLAPPPVPCPKPQIPVRHPQNPSPQPVASTSKAAAQIPAASNIKRAPTDESLYAMGSDDDSMFTELSMDECSGINFADRSRIHSTSSVSTFDPAPRAVPSSAAVKAAPAPAPASSNPVADVKPSTLAVRPNTASSSKQPMESSSAASKGLETKNNILAGLLEIGPLSQSIFPSQPPKRPSSGGGFVIPPGVTRPQRPASAQRVQEQRPISGIGSKRLAADAFKPSANLASSARSALSELEVENDGSVKRPRLN
ncbi:DNA repair and recombination protein radC AltName: Full=RAD52 homolog [Serendipita indica DSM 11827]|uniref:Related to RAD52-recombination and DNA repair protein n=1 Tax=Serendipita indica (strain DSM 11827) TaxID=1109443 RepID=G4TCL8_SERID|nr:DNA repair and recombination protein radC AltName: Full=RAD52 homolog [Serendipita indica DSM 11827]CCA69061.1 related to RAD52-recombination and DNA repair protein [Serendipita indica DSM 11827]